MTTREDAAREYAGDQVMHKKYEGKNWQGRDTYSFDPELNKIISLREEKAHLAGQILGEARVREIVEETLDYYAHLIGTMRPITPETFTYESECGIGRKANEALAKLKELGE